LSQKTMACTSPLNRLEERGPPSSERNTEDYMRNLWSSRFAAAALLLGPMQAFAQGAPIEEPRETPPAPTAPAPEEADEAQAPEQLKITIGGVFSTWFQNQQNFTFGAADYNDRYVVQMLRFNLSFGYGDYVKAVTRLDIAQGWWGVDNENWREANNASPNASTRFGNKDTNYGPHVDHGYLEFKFPSQPITARIGRMYYGAGNRIMLDSNFDGIQLDLATSAGKFGIGWAKVSEGATALYDIGAVKAPGGVCGKDADLLMASFTGTRGALNFGVFGFHYNDGNATPLLPMRLDYALARFRPAISQLSAIGFTANYDAKSIGLKLETEANYLFGKDDFARTDSRPLQMLDLNNGDLSGYNLYARATKVLTPKADLGFIFGMGSGDDDVTSGKGNVNHLKTMGFFYVSELWDDSIMPDEEGITPQGLGAPNVRAYRELENTTIGQVNLTFRPINKWRTMAAYSLIRATQPVRGWTAGTNGVVAPNNFTTESSKNLGSEVDFLVMHQPYPRLDLTLRGGYFMAEDASLLLVNGRTTGFEKKNPWELKAEVTYRF
jgi:hypothetical protein